VPVIALQPEGRGRSAMNAVDLLVVALLAGAVVHGLALGAASQVISFAGLWGGLALAAGLAPHVRELGDDATAQMVLLIATLVVVPAATTSLARILGVRAWRAMQRARLGLIDAGAGAVLAGAATLLVCSLVAGVVARIPHPAVTSAIQQSVVLRAADAVLPPTSSLFARIGRLLDPLGFPEVFAGLEPDPPPDLPAPPDAVVRAALARARPSVVQITGDACGATQRGSGFIVGRGLVVRTRTSSPASRDPRSSTGAASRIERERSSSIRGWTLPSLTQRRSERPRSRSHPLWGEEPMEWSWAIRKAGRSVPMAQPCSPGATRWAVTFAVVVSPRARSTSCAPMLSQATRVDPWWMPQRHRCGVRPLCLEP
jgi:uncharacterized membrane protein required for colicin V production